MDPARRRLARPSWRHLLLIVLVVVADVAVALGAPPALQVRAASTYAPTVLADAPGTYWRLGETSGSAAADASGHGNTGTYQTGVTLAQAGAIVGDSDTAVAPDGASGYVSSSLSGQSVATLEVWLDTTTTTGGLLAGVDATQTGAGTLTQALYMTNTGSVVYGVSPTVTVQSTGTYKDGKWHHAVGTVTGSAISLYMDGILVQSLATAVVPGPGFVRAGFDNLVGWTKAPTRNFFTGSIDEVAAYPTALSSSQVGNHLSASANLPGAPTIGTVTGGVNQVTVKWTAPASAGGSAITGYRVFAFQGGQQVAVATAGSGATSSVVKGLVGSYTFKVAALNSEGLGPPTASSASATATAGASATYFQTARGDNPTSYWRLSDPYGLTFTDASATGTDTGTQSNGITRSQSGALSNGSGSSPDGDLSAILDGTTGSIATSTSSTNPVNYSLEAWFKSNSAKGGPLIAFDNGAGTTDRAVYLTKSGNLAFGVNPGVLTVITSPLTYKGNLWHQVVATQSSTGGLALYVDGYLVAANAAATTAGNYTGSWRMGFENLAGWPQQPTSNYLAATMDEVAVYGAALSPTQVLAHFQAAQATPAAPAPGTVTTGTNSAALTWTAVPNASRGMSAITAYRVSAYSGGVLQDTVTAASTATSVTMGGLLGSTYTFRVLAVNSEGGGTQGSYTGTSTISGAATYASTVLADSPSPWYRFSDPASAPSVADQSGGTGTGTYQLGVTRWVAGALALSTGGSADGDTAVTLDGTTGSVTTSATLSNPAPFSGEVWFKTTSATGGALFGFDNGGAADRVLYLSNAGNLVFGVNPGVMTTITSPRTYRDGVWHHVVASLGARGMVLSVDGYQVAGNPSVTTAANVAGSWRIGGETLTGWPSAPSSSFLAGSIDDVAFYPTQLSAARVQAHMAAAAITPGAPALGTVTTGTNTAQVTWTAPASVGDSPITGYRISASSGGQLQDTVTAASTATSATVYGLTGTYTLRVVAVNSEGAGASATTASTTVSGAATFFSTLRADSPSVVYRFDDPSLGTVTDASAAGTDSGTPVDGVTIAAAGALGSTTDADTGVTLDGTTGYVSSAQQLSLTGPFSLEVKFKTTSSTGGVLVDLGSASTGLSTTVDRVLYVTNAGNVVFGVSGGAIQTITSPLTYLDGQWHTASATVSAAGTMTLYVDTSPVATGATSSTSSSGYWRVGFDNLAGWPSAPTSNFFSGSVDELSVFPTALSAAQVQAHFNAGGQVPSGPGTPVLSAAQQSQMTATWTAPTSQGASPIISYTLSASAPGDPSESITIPSSTLTATVGGLASGTSYTFTVLATNSQGNGPGASASGVTAGTPSSYLPAILADGASHDYRVDEATGSTAWDFAADDDGTFAGGSTLGAGGATATDGDHATTLNGSTGLVSTSAAETSPASVTVEAWFKTSSNSGGVIAGFGNLQTGTSTTYDRVLYLSNSGAVLFGINTGSKVTVASSAGFNDGQWHMAVGTLASGEALTLYVDGDQVATNAGPFTATSYTGYWRLGNQTVTGYTSAPASSFLNGGIDEVAIFPLALTSAQVADEFALAGPLPGAPTGLTTTVSAQDVLVGFSAPSAGDSPISGYTIVAQLSDGTTVQTVTVPSSPGLIGGLAADIPYTLTVAANNAEGQGAATSTTATTGPASAYFDEVQGDGPDMGWYRFDESQGTTAFDFSSGGGNNTGTYHGGSTLGQAGGLASDSGDGAVLLNGTSGYVSSSTSTSSPDPLTAEVWFKTTSAAGGELVGLGSSQTGSSASVDRVLYMTTAGTLRFGVHPGAYRTVASTRSYNDGQWHLADATWSSTAGLQLLVDDQLVGSDPTATTAASITGFWRIGYDNLAGWPSAPASNYFGGSVDEAALSPAVLTTTQIGSHFAVSGAAPGAPSITSVSPSTTAATVSWTAPASSGISPLTSYTLTASAGGVVRQSAVMTPSTTSTTLGGLIPGGTYTFVVTAANSEGSTPSPGTSTATTGSPSLDSQAVSGDGPSLWYRLDEGTGGTAWDSSGSINSGTYQGTVTLGRAGALPGDSSDTSVQLDGSTGYVSSSIQQSNPTTFSLEAWIRTTSASGGLVIGLGSSQTGSSATTDRVLYMTSAGQVVFGTNPSGSPQTISSPASLNDGTWHHMVAVLSSSGMTLYVDGRQAATSPATGARVMSGYWRTGFDTLTGWPTAPASNFLAATVDEVAVYPTALTLSQVQNHYRAAVGPLTLALTGVPASLTLNGSPNQSVTLSNAATYTVTTNDPLGYTVTVQAGSPSLIGATPGNADTIPIADVGVRAHGGGGFLALSSSAPVVVRSTTAASAVHGDVLDDDYQAWVPFVDADTYSVDLTYVVSAN